MAQNKLEQDLAANYALLQKIAKALGIDDDTQSAIAERKKAEDVGAAYWAVGGEGYNDIHGIKPKQQAEAQAEDAAGAEGNQAPKRGNSRKATEGE